MVYKSGSDLIQDYMKARNADDIDLISSFFHADMVVHFPPSAAVTKYIGAQAFTDSILKFRSAFSGWNEEVVELWGDGEKVVCRAIERGTHVGDYNGIAASMKKVEMRSTTVFRVSGIKILEQWYMYDAMILMQQLGVTADFLEANLFPERANASNNARVS